MIPPQESIRYIAPNQLDASVASIVDVRTAEAFAECHADNALNFCVYEVTFVETIEKAVPDKGSTIVVYGESEQYHAAPVAAHRLQEAGYCNVFVLQGGLEAWIANELPHVKRAPAEKSLAGRYSLNLQKTKVRWIGRNLTNQHDGTIACKSGFLEIAVDGTAQSGELVVDMKQIHCNDISDTKLSSLLVSHLESIDFFQTEKYPSAQFSLDRVFLDPTASPGTPNARMEGQMQIRGKKQPLHLECTLAQTDTGYVLQTQFDLDRTAFGAVYGSARFFERLGMHLVNDLVNLQITAFFEKKAA
ncbi:YceI family protein [Pelagicoccus enzymogenes]|uniref:YceI family protein n=1 Tax=Pelagicoccus enzymogenes TaxID=2773457 RepID=UPI00280C7C75|nr:YceI family protein [Pelagicoccus enzymogenes]MDQ8199518.1 YceI family protein [Pelagicoccus enzymogenes]